MGGREEANSRPKKNEPGNKHALTIRAAREYRHLCGGVPGRLDIRQRRPAVTDGILRQLPQHLLVLGEVRGEGAGLGLVEVQVEPGAARAQRGLGAHRDLAAAALPRREGVVDAGPHHRHVFFARQLGHVVVIDVGPLRELGPRKGRLVRRLGHPGVPKHALPRRDETVGLDAPEGTYASDSEMVTCLLWLLTARDCTPDTAPCTRVNDDYSRWWAGVCGGMKPSARTRLRGRREGGRGG